MQKLLSTRARERDKIRVWLLKVRFSSFLRSRWPRPTPVPSRFAYSGFAATSNWRASSSSFDWFVSRETGAHSTLRRGIIKRTECKDQGESGRDEKAESRRDRERRGEESSSASLTPRVLVSSCAKKPTEITGNSDDAALRQHHANERTGYTRFVACQGIRIPLDIFLVFVFCQYVARLVRNSSKFRSQYWNRVSWSR